MFLLRAICMLFLANVVLSESVLELTDNDFSSITSQHETMLIMFFAPWCGHCKKIKPEFERAGQLLEGNDPPITLAKVDCTEAGKETCNKNSVSGYPTLKIFRNGEFSKEYNGPREANGIVKYMKAQVGPSSKELVDLAAFEDFISKNEAGVVGFFDGESGLKKLFLKLADKERENVRFGHVNCPKIMEEKNLKNKIVVYRAKHLSNKFEDDFVVYDGAEDQTALLEFINKQSHGLVGHRQRENQQDFKNPLVVAYYGVDYVKNVKGTNYWRNRILKVAKNFADSFQFAISSKDDFQHELNEFGFDFVSPDKPLILARSADNKKFVMKEEFSLENFEKFLNDLKGNKLEPFLKSEPIPEDNNGPVIVAVGKNFDEVVTNNNKDTLIEFYAPWCGHCKKLTPVYEELGEKLKDEDVSIVKMDATANDVPSTFDVRGFPTLYWKPKDSNIKPVRYEGGREVDDFVKFIAKQATNELKGYDRQGKPKSVKTEL
uniref:Protein disulfide-isomerase n=1 Tax=Clastoptera arizonana TaxID=38151 RepID=A0A1B6CLZ3_9HEMI